MIYIYYITISDKCGFECHDKSGFECSDKSGFECLHRTIIVLLQIMEHIMLRKCHKCIPIVFFSRKMQYPEFSKSSKNKSTVHKYLFPTSMTAYRRKYNDSIALMDNGSIEIIYI